MTSFGIPGQSGITPELLEPFFQGSECSEIYNAFRQKKSYPDVRVFFSMWKVCCLDKGYHWIQWTSEVLLM